MNKITRLHVTDLACSRGERLLFAGLSFALCAGEALVITGPNGAGKTTLLRVIAGFLTPDKGTIGLDGLPDDDGVGRALHFVGHRDGLKAALTIRENLAMAPALYGQDGASIEHVADALNLTPLLDLPVAVLSAGQRRRAALARLRVAHRPIWLLDEPTSALDTASKAIVADLMADHLKDGGIILAATHLALGVTARELAFDANGGHALETAA